MKYRPEIDGLRAVAVLPVILFHAGVSVFSGGFIGVDVFFVISGYLITTIIMNESAQGNFSLRNFYIRRARRILPALFTVLLACIFFANLWMLPAQLEAFSKSVFSALFFYSNFYFWKQNGYFAEASDEMPLLHIWSLAVEEQYYLAFPVIIILLWSYKKEYIPHVIIAGALVSFTLAEVMSRIAPEPSFYLAHTRAWELFIGSLAAIYTIKKAPSKNNVFSMIGLGLIIYSIFFFDETTRWPSAATLAPTIGTALVILYCSTGTFVYKILSMRAFVAVGLISYSAYLWHHPLFAFARIRDFEEPSIQLMLVLSITSLILAYFSWRYIEAPFRAGKSLFGVRPLKLTVSFSVLFIAIALFGYKTEGFPQRFNEDIQRIVAAKNDYDSQREKCEHSPKRIDFDTNNCWQNSSDNKDTILLGDSHASVISYELNQSLEKLDKNLLKYAYSGCVPISNLIRKNRSKSHKCNLYNEKVLQYIKSSTKINTVILHGRWPAYVEASNFNNGEGAVETENDALTDVADGSYPELPTKERVKMAYKDHIKKLLNMGKKVVIVYPVPEAGWNVPDYTASQTLRLGYIPEISTSYEVFKKRNHDTFEALDSIQHKNLYRFYPHKYLCSEKTGRCINANENAIYYIDDDHLSLTGTRLFADDLAALIKSIPTNDQQLSIAN